jgi:hypothetical protein
LKSDQEKSKYQGTLQDLIDKSSMVEKKMKNIPVPRILFIVVAIFTVSCRFVENGVAFVEPTVGPTTVSLAVPTTEPTTGSTTEPIAEPTTVYIPQVTNSKPESPEPSPSPEPNSGNNYYVATNGSSNGNGSLNRPWDITTALDHPNSVEPGDTIWLRGGVYGRGGQTIINSKLTGEPDNPITIRAYPNEHVILDGNVMVYKPWVVFWGLEVMNSDTKRSTTISGSHPDDIYRSTGFLALAPNTKYINNIVRDGAAGISAFAEAEDTEIYGNIIYNNGWIGPDRGHGHGFYGQNETGWKTIEDNVIFNNFSSYGVHVYGESALLNNFRFNGNVHFNGKFLIGGSRPSRNISLTNNYFYDSNVQLGRGTDGNQGLTFTGNYLGGTFDQSFELKLWQNVQFLENTIWNSNPILVYISFPRSPGTYQWNENEYYSSSESAFKDDNSIKRWSNWVASYGYDSDSSFEIGEPSGTDIYIRPNNYEAKRAHIAIYNWDQKTDVMVDISGIGFENGDSFTLRNIQNLEDEPIKGTYNGAQIRVPMTGWTIANPVGMNSPISSTTFPRFGVFLLTADQ